ncbi:MAG: hypothetical protein QXE84_03795 [Candidatus Nitrosotenuis sp.]|uniref:Uncharacterized protein n=1 Tax=Candidatus Nitrosotenuis uzonensis TaxID=1407055 RepID=A0A812F091_9ARCH|nr:hypothetical protein [Candidatus Nitrosotenuis uzonensis]CAE6497907.1 conserved hypothetical protein [Candidatus Nitrosotenuis uzonensis]
MRLSEYLKTVIFSIGIVSVSHVLITLFGQTIPNYVSGFFREVGGAFMLVFVFAFAFAWFLRARPHSRPKKYAIVAFDVFGNQVELDGLRTEFRNHDVAWSFMKQYKKDHPLHNFAMVADTPNSEKKTIFRYI